MKSRVIHHSRGGSERVTETELHELMQTGKARVAKSETQTGLTEHKYYYKDGR